MSRGKYLVSLVVNNNKQNEERDFQENGASLEFWDEENASHHDKENIELLSKNYVGDTRVELPKQVFTSNSADQSYAAELTSVPTIIGPAATVLKDIQNYDISGSFVSLASYLTNNEPTTTNSTHGDSTCHSNNYHQICQNFCDEQVKEAPSPNKNLLFEQPKINIISDVVIQKSFEPYSENLDGHQSFDSEKSFASITGMDSSDSEDSIVEKENNEENDDSHRDNDGKESNEENDDSNRDNDGKESSEENDDSHRDNDGENSPHGYQEITENLTETPDINMNLEHTEIEIENLKPSRKRKRQPEKWKRNVKKQKLNHGERKTGKNETKRRLRNACNEKCIWKCTEKISNQERENKLAEFWKVGDINEQRQYILRHAKSVNPKYRYPKSKPDRATRSNNRAYYFSINGTETRVCKKFFHATLDISDMMSRTAFKKEKDGVLERDMRGKHAKKNKMDNNLVTEVKKHIESIPAVESHYLRAQTKRKYVEGGLNLRSLYRLYVEEQERTGKPYVKYHYYAHTFNYEYNIGFYSPKKDQCSLCTTYKNSTVEEKAKMEKDYIDHHNQKTLSREEKKKDLELAEQDPSILVAVYDLQAVLTTPCGETSDFFYKSKLATLNFTIYDILKKNGYCYVWDETTAKRGANEIGSFILHFLSIFAKEYKNFTFYSDNCCGQNKNKFVMALYLYALNNLQHVDSITHKYLITGHTQNEGDSMHSTIEKEKRRYLKSNNIYVPAQWIPIIALSKKKSPPYVVYEVKQREIYDLKALCEEMGKNFSINTRKEKVNWNQIKQVHFKKNSPRTIFYKTDYTQKEFDEIQIDYRQRKHNTNIELKQKYYQPLPISKKKYEGLIELCKKNLIKKEYHSFFEHLPFE